MLRPPDDVGPDAAQLAVLEATATLGEPRSESSHAAGEARAANTERDWCDFATFCARIDREPLPAEPETIALYLADLMHRGHTAVTWARRLSTIAVHHRAAGFSSSPTEHEVVRSVHRGLRRRVTAARHRKTALVDEHRRQTIGAIDLASRIGLRDRAILLLGFAGAFRRGELAALEVSDLRFEPEGVVIRLRRSKGDQEGAGVYIVIPLGIDKATCPVGALQLWLERAEISEGRVFRRIDRRGNVGTALSDRAVAEIVHRRAADVGIESGFTTDLMRLGTTTLASHAGKTEGQRYIRAGQRWED